MPIVILGVKIDNLKKSEVLEKIKFFLKSEQQHHIVTPNPEFLVAAQKDEKFKKILNEADLAIPDGTGLVFASWLQKDKIKQRITGADLIDDICKIAEQNLCSIYFLGGEQDVAKKTAENLKQKFQNLMIAGTQDGMPAGQTNLELIKNSSPDILLVAFGQVKQEKWIKDNLTKLPSVKIAIGVGGAFDYISGKIKRAPKIFKSLGLEWLFRLIVEPKRWRRIYNAVIKFPILVIKEKWNINPSRIDPNNK